MNCCHFIGCSSYNILQGIRTKSLASSPLNPINHEKIGQCRQHTQICVTSAHQTGAIQLHLHKNKDVRPAVFWVPYYKLTVVAEDTIVIYNLHTNPQPPQPKHTHTLLLFLNLMILIFGLQYTTSAQTTLYMN